MSLRSKIDDHHVLGAVLRARGEVANECGIFLRRRAARPRSLDRPRLDLAIGIDPQEAFRRRAEDLKVAEVEVRGERRGVELSQPPVEFERMLAERREQPLRQIHLEAIARVDVLDHAPHRGLVAGAVEVARDAGEAGEGVLRGTRSCRDCRELISTAARGSCNRSRPMQSQLAASIARIRALAIFRTTPRRDDPGPVLFDDRS